jgi:hypothetical protein
VKVKMEENSHPQLAQIHLPSLLFPTVPCVAGEDCKGVYQCGKRKMKSLERYDPISFKSSYGLPDAMDFGIVG